MTGLKDYLRKQWRLVRSLPARVRYFVTGTLVWVAADGTKEVERVPRQAIWDLLGPQPVTWWWVQKWGRLACGCQVNPITRKHLLTSFRCTEHAIWLAVGDCGGSDA